MNVEPLDVLHLYLGCECIDSEYPEDGKFTINHESLQAYKDAADGTFPKPLIRPISSMTALERSELEKISMPFGNIMNVEKAAKHNAITTMWFLKERFDLFGLIESGKAIDKSKL